jgi:hypothetical protein
MRNLRNQQRRRIEHNRIPKPQYQPRRNEHPDVLRPALQRHRTKHDNRPDHDPHLAPLPVNQIGYDGQSDERAERHGAVEKTQHSPPWNAEVGLPVGKGLKAVHHGAVEAVRRVCQD